MVDVDINNLAEGSPVLGSPKGCAAIKYLPLNAVANLNDKDGVEPGADMARLGYLNLAAVFDPATVRVVKPVVPGVTEGFLDLVLAPDSAPELEDYRQEIYEDALDGLTEVGLMQGPAEWISGFVTMRVRHRNKKTRRDFWHLKLQMLDDVQLDCCVAHPAKPGEPDSVDPFPVGAVVSGNALFTGYFRQLGWHGELARSEAKSPFTVSSSWVDDEDCPAPVVPSARSIPLTRDFYGFAEGFSAGQVFTDISTCLGFPIANPRQALYTLMSQPKGTRWASASRFNEIYGQRRPSARATVAAYTQVETMPEWRRLVFGMSMPVRAWGAAVSVGPGRQVEDHWAAVDCELLSGEDEADPSIEALLGADLGLDRRQYGDAVVTAVSAIEAKASPQSV